MVTEIGWKTTAIIVSFNGSSGLEKNLLALLPQVKDVVIVDNGSRPEELDKIRLISFRMGVQLIELMDNSGIGVALNRGLDSYEARRASWILTLDQDSVIAPDFLDALTEAINADPTIVCATPSVDVLGHRPGVANYHVDYAITSGNLLSAGLIREVGHFDEGMFIDGVDFDYSLRIRRAGHLILRVTSARMCHSLGDVKTRIPFYTIHNRTRRYYMCRNFVVLMKRYMSFDPKFLIKLSISHLVSNILTLLLGPDRIGQARSMFAGTVDGLRGRQGPGSMPC